MKWIIFIIFNVLRFNNICAQSILQQLSANNGAIGDLFGSWVSVWNNYAVISAHNYDSANAVSLGSAYIFKRSENDEWIQIARLNPNPEQTLSYSGKAVAIFDRWVVVAVPYDDVLGSEGGTVYMYERDESVDTIWRETHVLLPTNDVNNGTSTSYYFGRTLSLYGRYLAVGAELDDEIGDDKGAVFVFERKNQSDWVQAAKLLPNNTGEPKYFGGSVSIYDKYIAIREGEGYNSSIVHIFEQNNNTNISTWTETSTITIDDATFRNGERSVSMNDKYLVIGANGVNSHSGSVYIFERDSKSNNWTQNTILVPDGLQEYDNFGYATAIYDDTVIVGMPYSGEKGEASGCVYMYKKDEAHNIWFESAKLLPPYYRKEAHFGFDVAIYSKHALIGANRLSLSPKYKGVVYVVKSSLNATIAPSPAPTIATFKPTKSPSDAPTFVTLTPSKSPTNLPSRMPTLIPSHAPSYSPSSDPTKITTMPSMTPSTHAPSLMPTHDPSFVPSMIPTIAPSNNPTSNPSAEPSNFPSYAPTISPTNNPTSTPTIGPTLITTITMERDEGQQSKDTNSILFGAVLSFVFILALLMFIVLFYWDADNNEFSCCKSTDPNILVEEPGAAHGEESLTDRDSSIDSMQAKAQKRNKIKKTTSGTKRKAKT